MNLKNERELEVTRQKLRRLEDQYRAIQSDQSGNAYHRELELHTFKRLINQLKEEIVRFEAHAGRL
jgi:predicted  nucleic acid-binding Zn-ribbon protein